MQEVSTASYWIASNALYITLNANGAPNYILGNTASGAHILCYVKGVDGLEYDAAHNYRRWPLSLTPTKFNTNTEKYVYVAIPRPTNPETTAVVVFPSEKLDLYGKNEAGRQIGSELYYYVWLRGIITATNAGETLERAWQQHVETGTLSSDEAIDAGGDQTWWRYSSVDDTVTFLKEIVMDAKSVFHNLKARILVLAGHELTGVATAETSEEFVDSETLVVTPNYLRKMTEDKFLRKDQDDATPYSLSVGGDLNVSGALHGIMGYFTSLFSNLLQSSNYTGDGAADTGFRLTADDGSGSSSMIVDVLHVRKKAIFEELEVKKEMSVAGNEVRSAAANIINRTDYINGQGEVIGYSYTRVPWMLRKMPFLLRGTFFGRLRKTRLVIDPQDVQNIQKIRCYFLAKDGDRDVQNLWQVGDLVRCQTFNLSQSKRYTYIDSATQNKPGNVFWWRKSVGVSTQTENIDGKDYHYVDVSMSDRWHTNTVDSDIPCAGDHMVQFGHDSNPDRMNLIVQEVNSSDAPAVKAYMGIYTYDESECWWGGTPRKMMLSPKSGYEFYGPSFKFIQEYGQAPASIDRGVYTEIATERDDFNTHGQVRKLYYYDKVSHNGCYWLCVMTGVGAHWVAKVAFTETVGGTTYTFSAGDYIPDNVYSGLVTNKTNCTRKENYTTEAPSETSTSWKKLVNSGDNMIRLDIDNSLDSVQTDSTCKVTAQRTITTNVRLYDGATEVAINNPTVTGISYTDANGQQQTLNPVITASGNGKQLSWTFLAGWTLQARYQVNISYTYLDVPYNVVFTLTASQGFEVLQLKPSLSAISFQRDASNQLTPASRTLGLSIVKIDGASTADITPATYGVSKIRYSLTEMPALISSGSAWPAAGTITVPNTAENVYIALFNIFDVLIDRETVPVIKDGEKGDSITKSSETHYYIKNTTGVRPAENDPNWSTTKPTLGQGEWLFTKTDILWSDGSHTILYTDERNPNDGIAGQDIIVDGATVMKYYVGTSNTTHPADDSSDWKDLSQVTQEQGKWLWSQATTYYRKADSSAGSHDAGSSINYNVSYISKDGKTGRGIQSITEYYQATNSSASRQVPTSESGWDTDPNLSHLTDKWNQSHKYLWNMEKTVYTNVDGSTTTEYSIPQILAIWTKDGNPGRGIDSIVNYYKVTSSATAPSKPATPGTDGWITTPTAPGQGEYLWNYERITWVNPSSTTETDVQMIGYAGTNGRTPQKGIDYNDGEDAWIFTAEPANVIITQSLGTNTSTFSESKVSFTVKKGGVDATVTSISIPDGASRLSDTFNAAIGTGTDSKKVIVSSPKTHGTPAEYYTDGSFTVKVNATAPDGSTSSKNVTVLCYANLLGTWKDETVGAARTEAINQVNYIYDPTNPNRVVKETTYSEYTRSNDQRVSTIGRSIHNTNYLKGLEDGSGWTDFESFEPQYSILQSFCVFLCENGMNVTSPIVELPAGTYTASAHGWDNESQINGITLYVMYLDDQGREQAIGYNRTEDIQGGLMKYTFTLLEATKVFLRFAEDNDEAFCISEPKIEAGTEVTEWESSTMSQIKQTADEIILRAGQAGLKIDGTNRVIEAQGNHFVVKNSSGNTTMTIDSDGNLDASGGATFKGSIVAEKENIGSWEIQPALYDTYCMPRIVGKDKDGNEVLNISCDSNQNDSNKLVGGGGMYFSTNQTGPIPLNARYTREHWRINSPGFEGSGNKSLIWARANDGSASILMSALNGSNDTDFNIVLDSGGASLYSNDWNTSPNAVGYTYVDAWGNLKVKRSSGYEQFNFIYGETLSGTNDIVLPQHTPDNPIPDGTTYYVKGNGSSKVWSYTPIMNSHNSSYWPQTNSYYRNTIYGQSHTFLMQTVNGTKVWIDFYDSAQVSPD